MWFFGKRGSGRGTGILQSLLIFNDNERRVEEGEGIENTIKNWKAAVCGMMVLQEPKRQRWAVSHT